MRIFILLLLGFVVVLPLKAISAKPISYPGGVMIHQENDETGYSFMFDYTVTPKYSLGIFAKKDRGNSNATTFGPQINTLIKRWNLEDGQGNVFNTTGAGVMREDGKTRPAFWTGILADYETRRVFSSYEVKLMHAPDIDTSLDQRARIGFAPYVGGYDDVHTWLMLQADYHPKKEEDFVVTPLVRVFYHTTMVEAGYSSNNKALFNWVLQF